MSDKGKPQGQAGEGRDSASRMAQQKAARLQAALRDNLRRRKSAAQLSQSAADVPAASDLHAEDDEQG